MLVNMKEILKEAEEKGYAIGCINTPNMETLRAVVDAAEELNVPIIIDLSLIHILPGPLHNTVLHPLRAYPDQSSAVHSRLPAV